MAEAQVKPEIEKLVVARGWKEWKMGMIFLGGDENL